MQLEVVFILFSFLFFLEIIANDRIKRFLIYPPSAPTRHQFIAGIGVPAELDDESVTIGYVLKAEFHLPYNASIWRTSPLVPEYREKRVPIMALHSSRKNAFQQKRNNSRWKIYNLLRNFFERLGYDGENCLLKTICDLGNVQFERDQSLLSEILYILLTPTLSSCPFEDCEDITSYQAENYGKAGGNCSRRFTGCKISPLDIISTVL